MVRKIVSIVLIIFGLVTAAEAAFYFSEYSRTQKVVEKGLLGQDMEESKSLIAKASGHNSYDSMVNRDMLYFVIALAIAVLMAASGVALLIFNPKVKDDLQFNYLYGEGDSQDDNQSERWRF
jgi:hypothetical protein